MKLSVPSYCTLKVQFPFAQEPDSSPPAPIVKDERFSPVVAFAPTKICRNQKGM